MWKEADPRVISLIQNSLQNFRHELLVGNSAGVPVVVQHGGADDNVPAFHSRRMHQLISQSPDAAAATYIELDGKGHWFDGVMSTTPLRTFYADVLGGAPGRPALPLNFSIAITNAADMGPRGGLVVDQLSVPDQLGKIDVSRSPALASWTIKTSNVRRFHLSPNDSVALPLELVIDDNRITLPASGETVNCWFLRSRGGVWQVINLHHSWPFQ